MSTPSSTNTTAARGWSAATIQSTCEREVAHARVVREHAPPATGAAATTASAEQHADHDPELEQSPADGPRVVRARRAEEAPDHRLARDRERVERRARGTGAPACDLVRGDRVVADARRDRGGREQGDDAATPVRTTSGSPTRRVRAHARRVAAATTRRRAAPARATITTYAIAAPYCASTVPQAEPAMPRSSPYTNSTSSSEVHDVGEHRDHERRLRVLHAAQVARRRRARAAARARRRC